MSTKSIKTQRQKSASSSPGNTAASLQVSLPQMLDLALGTPEVGAVNFNILHNFLHVILHQINLRNTKVEYRGEDAQRIKTMVTSLKDGPSLHLHEYSITDSSGRIKQRIHSDQNLTVNVDIYTDDATGKNSRGSVSAREIRSKQEINDEKNAKKVKGVKQQISGGVEGKFESVIFVEPVVDGATPSALNFKKLENSVQKLQQQYQILEELATNPELINKVKGNNTDPLKDMWQIININKRLDASEQGISKLTSMLQDIIKSDKIELQSESDVTTQLTEMDHRLLNLERLFEERVSHSRNIKNSETNFKESKKITNESEKTVLDETTKEIVIEDSNENKPNDFSETLLANVNNLRNDVNQVRNDIAELQSKLKEASEFSPKLGETEKETQSVTKITGNKNRSNTTIEGNENNKSESGEKIVQATDEKQQKIEETEKSENLISTVADEERGSNDKNFESCLNALKELGTRVDNVEKSTIANNLSSNDILETKIQKIEEEMEKLIQTNKIIEDKENSINKNTLQEQIEVLKVLKVDKEDFQDALANKADAMTVSRKVSFDQFDVTRDDLARGLEEALDKLNQQELIWQRALDEVHKEIECKLDKEEISPFKESVDSKFQRLQEKMKILFEMKEPNEAAATKKMLRDVQCLSCDKDVVMRMYENNPMYANALSSIKKMQLRTQPKKMPPQRKDMLYLEAALKEERNSKFMGPSTKDEDKRFCGGSHTIISPQQKIMRVGNFMNQWGSQVIQLPAGIIKGSDGKTYYSRPLIGEHISKTEEKICEPCDNKCNSKQLSKESLVPQSDQQIMPKKGSYVSEIEEKPENIAFIESYEGIYEQSSEENKMILIEDPPPPPSSPLQAKSLENEQPEDEEALQTSRTMGVGSFFEESKSIAQIAFEEDNDNEFEENVD